MQKFWRESNLAQIPLCVALGIAVGAVTMSLQHLALFLHRIDFALRPGERLSGVSHISPLRIIATPVAGGAPLGMVLLAMSRLRSWEIVDPIEANAIHGGRMSVNDSLRLIAATLLSNAAGASAGMEAGDTQIGASINSWMGHRLKLRREDRRVLVAAGAGAAIVAAFHAPLAGAFYGFELVLTISIIVGPYFRSWVYSRPKSRLPPFPSAQDFAADFSARPCSWAVCSGNCADRLRGSFCRRPIAKWCTSCC